MAGIPEEVIERVRDAHDIVDLVGRTVPLKKAGSAWKACCPFHEEKTPSFQVNPTLQIFKCFGCGKGGNVFHWLIETQGMTFPEAVRSLADERNIPVPEAGPRSGPPREQARKLREALTLARRWFSRQLKSEAGAEARSYLTQRGYDDAAQERFGLGYAPAAWDGLLTAAGKAGFSPKLLADAGLAKPRERGGGFYDVYRHRIMFPIADWQGRPVTFAGRAMDPDEQAKYINGPETALFKKSGVLFALDLAKHTVNKAGEALLLEGYTDVLQCHLHGFEQAVAAMGTAFTDRQARLLRRFAERVVLLYDGDEAGQRAAERTLETMLAEGFEVRVATLPAGRDVDEILLEEGPEAVAAILAAAQSVLDFKLATLGRQMDLSSPRGRAKAAEALLPTLLKVRSPVEREQWIKQAAEQLGGSHDSVDIERVLRGEAGRLVSRSVTQSRRPGPGAGPAAAPRGPDLPGISALDRARREATLVAGALADETVRDEVFRSVGPEEFATPVFGRLYNALFDLYERGKRCDREALATRLAEDGEALAALAELPDDSTLLERVRSEITFLERQRASRESRESVLAQLAAARDGRASPRPASALDAAGRSDSPPTDSGSSNPSRSGSKDNHPDAAPHAPSTGPSADPDLEAPPADVDAAEFDDVPVEGDPWSPPVLDGPDGTRVFDDGWADDDPEAR